VYVKVVFEGITKADRQVIREILSENKKTKQIDKRGLVYEFLGRLGKYSIMFTKDKMIVSYSGSGYPQWDGEWMISIFPSEDELFSRGDLAEVEFRGSKKEITFYGGRIKWVE